MGSYHTKLHDQGHLQNGSSAILGLMGGIRSEF